MESVFCVNQPAEVVARTMKPPSRRDRVTE
jgi:hypothetical protein